MNQAYVEALQKPDNDQELIRKNANELITDRVFLEEIIRYSIENLLEAAQAYYDDCDPNKLYYKVALKDKTRNFCFDMEHLPHLLGLPTVKILIRASIMNKLIRERTTSSNWLEVFKRTLESHKDEIIEFDSNPDNLEEQKLNWDKISEKVFSFLNLGILSVGQTMYYRENISPVKNKIKNYLMIRPLVNKEITGRLIIPFVLQEYNGQEYFVPTSIRFERKNELPKRIIINGIDYKPEGLITNIQQIEGGNYGKK